MKTPEAAPKRKNERANSLISHIAEDDGGGADDEGRRFRRTTALSSAVGYSASMAPTFAGSSLAGTSSRPFWRPVVKTNSPRPSLSAT